MLEIGSIIDGKYKILNKIGQGGMSVVYLAMNERANKQWAVKEVRKDGVSNFEVVKQGLVAEVDMLKKFNHPHLPSIIDVIDGDGSFLIVMDYIEGVSLNKKLKEAGGALPQDDVIEWGKQLCDVLGYLHSRERPIIYRDMKPANVMLKPDGNVMLIDFGTAREFKSDKVEDTTCLGTQGYAAPEQFGGHGQTDARTDIYCLGATLYHLITGHNPCEYPYEMYPIRQWNPQLSSGLESIILKCTQKNPNDRYQSCAELMYALEHYRDFELETLKAQNIKWRSFLSVTLASLVMFGAAITFNTLDKRNAEFEYNKALTSATEIADLEDLEYAASIFPERVEPYVKALEIIDADDEFTTEERTKLLETLLDPSSKYKDELSAENEAYYRFCYDLALSYFFSYDNTLTGIANAQKWFNIAATATPFEKTVNGKDYSMTSVDIANAEVLYSLSAAVAARESEKTGNKQSGVKYTEVGGENEKTGQVEYTEKMYWDELNQIREMDFFKEGNTVTKRRVYSWILDSMKQDFHKLNTYGVKTEDLEAVRDAALEDLTELYNNSEAGSKTREELETLIANFETVADYWG